MLPTFASGRPARKVPTTATGDDVEDHGYLSSALLTVAERVAATV